MAFAHRQAFCVTYFYQIGITPPERIEIEQIERERMVPTEPIFLYPP
jgi:hypothetical protein